MEPAGRWSADAFAALRRDVAGIQYVELIPGMPPIGLDVSGLEELVARGEIGNPLLGLDDELVQDGEAALAVDQPKRLWDQAKALSKWQDDVLAVIVVDPPYAKLDTLERGKRPEGKLCLFDFPADARRLAASLMFQGVAALESFRAEQARLAAASGREGLRVPPEPGLLPDGPAASPSLAGSGDLVPGDAPRPETSGGRNGTGAPSPARTADGVDPSGPA